MKKRFEPVDGRNAEIIEAVMQSDEVSPLSEDLKFKIRLCVEEVEENILGYSGTTWIDLEVLLENQVLSIGFRDGGVEFDPLASEDPDVNAALEERKIGGLGIFICKQMMDSLSYEYVDNCNSFIMRKKLN